MIKNILRKRHYYKLRALCTRQFKEAMKLNGIADKACDGERQWLERWSVFGVGIETTQYRLFHHYIGSNMDIVPEEISNCFIEPVLNPEELRGAYLDKNFFNKLLPENWLPTTYLRKMNGHYYDRYYNAITLDDNVLQNLLADADEIIVKPALDSSWGIEVRAFFRQPDGRWTDSDGATKLSTLFLDTHYGNDLIVQEKIRQSEFASRFNPTSANTIRMAVYRSVKDDTCHCIGAVMRIGGKGSVVDNTHGGGHFVGIDMADGTLHKTVYSQEGEGSATFNGIDFGTGHRIPDWDKVVAFGEAVGSRIPHHRLVALDIALAESGPVLIEFNVKAYGTWVFQYTSGSAFGSYADEIIDYCLKNKGELLFRY